MTTILLQQTTQADLRKLVGASLKGNLSNVPRELLICVLELVVSNLDSRKHYLTELYRQASSGQEFRVNPLNASILDSIREHRFQEIDHEVLLSIAGSCLAICQICEEVNEEDPQAWEPVFLKIGEFIAKRDSNSQFTDALESDQPSPTDDLIRPSAQRDNLMSKSDDVELGLALGGEHGAIEEGDEDEDADDED